MDWQRVHVELVGHKHTHSYHNLTVPYGIPRQIIEAEHPSCYELRAPDEWIAPCTADQLARLQDTVEALLKKYMDKFYLHEKQRWESSQMVYDRLTVSESNFQDYRVSVPRSDPELVKTICAIVEEAKKLKRKKKPEGIYGGTYEFDLPNIHFDRHLYQPLLTIRKNGQLKVSPPPLNSGEKQFVDDLRVYCKKEGDGALKGKELFLLRNLSKGKGIGFFDSRGFYPDFVVWIKKGAKQRIVFVEPHGMMLEQGNRNNEKLSLHKRLQTHSRAALKKAGLTGVSVDAYVVSVTPYDRLHKHFAHDSGAHWTIQEFADEHVLFQEEGDYITRIVAG